MDPNSKAAIALSATSSSCDAMLGAVCPELELYVMEVPNFEERLEAKSKFCSKLATVSNFLKAMTRPLVRTNLHY